MHPYRIGSIAGAVGATVFVLAYRGQLPDPWPLVALVGWLLALGVYVWAVWVRPVEALPEGLPPRRHGGLIYLVSVVLMIALIQVGRVMLEDQGREELLPAVIMTAVGLHLVPFAHAFRAPVFTALGWVLTGIGLAGGLAGWVLDSGAVAAGAVVLGGLLMLGLIAQGALRGDEVPEEDELDADGYGERWS